jgi:hypothetical protein
MPRERVTWSEGNGQLQAPPQNDPPTASTVTAPLPPDPAVPCDVVAQRKDGSTRRQNADTCALAADRPQSLSVIGTLARHILPAEYSRRPGWLTG